MDFPKDGTFGKSEAVFGPDLTNAPKFGFNLRPEPSGNELKLTPVIFVRDDRTRRESAFGERVRHGIIDRGCREKDLAGTETAWLRRRHRDGSKDDPSGKTGDDS